MGKLIFDIQYVVIEVQRQPYGLAEQHCGGTVRSTLSNGVAGAEMRTGKLNRSCIPSKDAVVN